MNVSVSECSCYWMCREVRAFEWSQVDIGTHQERVLKLGYLIWTQLFLHIRLLSLRSFKNSNWMHGANPLELLSNNFWLHPWSSLVRSRCFVMRNTSPTGGSTGFVIYLYFRLIFLHDGIWHGLASHLTVDQSVEPQMRNFSFRPLCSNESENVSSTVKAHSLNLGFVSIPVFLLSEELSLLAWSRPRTSSFVGGLAMSTTSVLHSSPVLSEFDGCLVLWASIVCLSC